MFRRYPIHIFNKLPKNRAYTNTMIRKYNDNLNKRRIDEASSRVLEMCKNKKNIISVDETKISELIKKVDDIQTHVLEISKFQKENCDVSHSTKNSDEHYSINNSDGLAKRRLVDMFNFGKAFCIGILFGTIFYLVCLVLSPAD